MADDYQIEEIYVNSTSENAIKNVDWGVISENDILVFACDSNGDVVRYENWELSKRESDGTWDIKIYPTQNSFTAYIVRNELASMQWSETANANLSVDAIKKQIENIVRVIKQLELINKTVVRTVDDIGVPLPNATKRAGKFISFDDNGNPVCEVNVDTFESNKASAEQSAKSASASATSASKSASNASTSEKNALSYCTSASTSEKNALEYAKMASNSSNIASNSADVARECKSKSEEYAQKAESSANLTGTYANTTTEMLTGKHAINNLRFKTESGEQIVVKAELVNGVPMLVPTIASDVLDDAFSVLQWKTASGQKFVVFAEIVNGVPMLSCKI